MTDKRVLNDLDAQSHDALFGAALNSHRASIGLPPVRSVRDYVLTDRPPGSSRRSRRPAAPRGCTRP